MFAPDAARPPADLRLVQEIRDDAGYWNQMDEQQ
jgi:hypothetical protein